jgi:hypothetical protein
MRPAVKIFSASLAGIIAGSAVNMALIAVSGHVIAPPAGVDTSTAEGLKAAMPLFQPRHFLFPFLAHALGTLVGAALATRIAGRSFRLPAALVAGFFLLGGAAAAWMLPAPAWFEVADLLLAYLPAAWLGYWIGRKGLVPARQR